METIISPSEFAVHQKDHWRGQFQRRCGDGVADILRRLAQVIGRQVSVTQRRLRLCVAPIIGSE